MTTVARRGGPKMPTRDLYLALVSFDDLGQRVG